MDIVVTIPKSRLQQVEKEEARVAEGMKRGEDWRYYWTLPSEPKSADRGDRCYFLWDGAVRVFHVIIGYREDFDGVHSVLLEPEIHEIEPIPMKGFRGFRYVREGSPILSVAPTPQEPTKEDGCQH